jgi:tRNA pseudouridine55 synthase
MDGLLVIDKPAGLTSHDVVARVRRVLGARRVGHTGTLDPSATGVLPLVLGRATRLARFVTAADKSYEAVVRLGVETDTYDTEGRIIGSAFDGQLPSVEEIERALGRFRGTFLQQPPAFSAKRIAGSHSYELARSRRSDAVARENQASLDAVLPAALPKPEPVEVSVHSLELLQVDAQCARLQITCSAGFYVRTLAHDLGHLLGTGAHLMALRRTRSGDYAVEDAIALAEVERPGDGVRIAAEAIVPLSRMLPRLQTLTLS